jgi:hypothetical protein
MFNGSMVFPGTPPLLALLRLTMAMVAVVAMVACGASLPTPSAPDPPIPIPSVSPTPLPQIEYTIQVGAFSTTGRAARYALGLQAGGLDAYHFIDSDGLCKVRFESYATKAAARRRAVALQAMGMIDDYYIVQPGMGRALTQRIAELRHNMVETARRFIGTPYRWGGESVQSGFDCSGLTMTVYRLNGLQLPRNSRAQFDAGSAVSQEALQIGDLVFFATGRWGRVSHVGVYSGQGRFIHAPGQGKRIRSASMKSGYFKSRYMGARRYF